MDKMRLHDVRVLVLEDDFYLAMDLQDALAAGGASVLGPFSETSDAMRSLDAELPDCALVDLNLGTGMCFELPHELLRRSVPFAFVTGYDRSAIPEVFADRPRAEKPVGADKAVELAERLLRPM